jgi:anti-sigma B factor antagonist
MEPDSTSAPEPRGFSLDVDAGDDVVTVTAHGEIDLDTSDEFGQALTASTTARQVNVDLADVSYMDSAGLRALLTARADAEQRSGQLRVVKASSIVSRLFEIAGVADLFDGS